MTYPILSACSVSSAGATVAIRRVHGQKISWWEGEKGLAFLQDVQLVDGELVVPRPGLYYVYAQTYFRHSRALDEDAQDDGGEDRGRPLLQYIYKKVMALSCIFPTSCLIAPAKALHYYFFSPAQKSKSQSQNDKYQNSCRVAQPCCECQRCTSAKMRFGLQRELKK